MTTIEVTGPLTLAEAPRWRSALSDGLVQGQGLRLDLADSGPWDLSGVQLLVAAIVSSKRAGRPIVLAHVPNVLIAIAERAALRDQLSAIIVD